MIDWRNAESDEMVCWCIQVDKETIVKAIQSGADTLKKVKETTDACTGNQCKIANPDGRCCSSDIIELIKIYG
jgi:NAD(P)H-nitrite reductase large subunit